MGDYHSQPRTIPAKAAIYLDFVGCKLNRHDIEMLRNQAQEMGFSVVFKKEEADLIVLDTCCVTNKAGSRSRAMIRACRRANPGSFIVITGCYCRIDPQTVQELDIDLVLDNRNKEVFSQVLSPYLKEPSTTSIAAVSYNNSVLQSRPYLKVQDGCDCFCSYCIIPFARGNPRSVPHEDVLKQVEKLSEAHAEINLCGLNLGKYENGPQYSLLELLKDLCAIPHLKKIRLASIEPLTFTDEFIEFVLSQEQICKHLHIPLQGATDRLLKDMNRPYNISEYKAIVQKIKSHCPELCLGADLITGFPGETDQEFEIAMANLKEMPIDYFHVFTYSQRPGTKAASFKNQIPGDIKKRHTREIYQISQNRFDRFIEAQLGKTTTAVIERKKASDSFFKGLTHNYIPLRIPATENCPELQEIRVRLLELKNGVVTAETINNV